MTIFLELLKSLLYGIVTALLDTGREVGYTARAVQKTVFGVEVKMDEGAHGRSPF